MRRVVENQCDGSPGQRGLGTTSTAPLTSSACVTSIDAGWPPLSTSPDRGDSMLGESVDVSLHVPVGVARGDGRDG